MTSPTIRPFRVIGHMVTRNELSRYLNPVLMWLRHLTDDNVHVHDDASDDGTFEYLSDAGVNVTQRPFREPSFLQNEGHFRQRAWKLMEERCRPTEADLILCVDADEFPLNSYRHCDTREALLDQVRFARSADLNAVTFDVAEAFRLTWGQPMIRVDGYWGQISACRLVRWRPEGLFATRASCGSVPASWTKASCGAIELALLHLGYVTEVDRHAKHDRYQLTTGHNPQHVASILGQPMLTPWMGQPLPLDVP
jgi:hypothetical protein